MHARPAPERALPPLRPVIRGEPSSAAVSSHLYDHLLDLADFARPMLTNRRPSREQRTDEVDEFLQLPGFGHGHGRADLGDDRHHNPFNLGEEIFDAVRAHWSVENSLHWTLDTNFCEDDSRTRDGYSAENLAMMRRMALSIMKRDSHSRRSLKGRRRICSYHDEYLERLLFNSDQTISAVRPG